MKKTTTIIVSLLVAVGMTAQIVPGQNHNGLLEAKNDKITMSGDEALSHLMVNPNPHTAAVLNSKSTITETLIGTSTYDLQSNAAVQNRILHHANGSISVAWTMSQQYNTTYSDRGTGYNFFDGTSWGAQPTIRLEGSRGGWPSMLKMGSGKEASMTHNTANSYINMAHRATTGSGLWTDQIISTQDSNGVYRYLIWNRSAVGGLNNETIHMVALTEPSGGTWTGVPFNGVSGALLYYRSQDEGVTWDRQDIQLPGTDSSTQIGMSGDVYAIAAQGETVVIAYFDDWGDSFIVKSTDNGDTWDKTTFLDFPVDKYAIDSGFDLDDNDTTDQVFSSDNCGAVILDANGQAHVFYGVMQYNDHDLTDGGSNWYPGTNMLAYWNESYGADYSDSTLQDTVGYVDGAGVVTPRGRWWSDMMNNHIITAAPDLNGDGIVDGVDSTGGYALYYISRASMPNAGISANGEIYLSFSGYTETIDNGTQVFRHVYITKSSDGGITWKNPVDVTPHTIWNGAQECVFASMNPVVDDKIRIVYQKDFEPGLAVRGDEDMVDNNEIIYLEIDTVGLFPNVNATWNCTNNACIDPGNGSGTYSTLSACQNNCTVTPTWDCIGTTCIDPGTGNGTYTSLSLCNAACVVLTTTWNCDNGVCTDTAGGSGTYASQSACLSNCVLASWDCDGQGNCYDPGTGNGQYSTSNACDTTCVTPTWDCTGTTCADPGTGQGAYTSLSACQNNCTVTATWDCINGVCIDPGTGLGAFASQSSCDNSCVLATWDCINGVCSDPGTGMGTYASQSACQNNCVTPTWDCTQNTCADPGTGQGAYTSLSACQNNCAVTATWECNNGVCSDPGTGLGTYASLAGCQNNCVAVTPSWNCTGTACADPGTGNGIYTSLSACQSNCTVAETWECDGQDNCSDPGTGLGTFASLSACQSNCVVNAIHEEISSLLIYPNPTKNTLTIDGNYISATIYDIFGKVVLTTAYQKTIDVAALSSGIYFIRMDNTIRKFIKQ